MKCLQVIVLLIMMATCTSRYYDDAVETRPDTPLPTFAALQELQAIDSLMWQQPDSALSVLTDFMACRDAMIASPDIVDSNLRRIQRGSTNETFDRHYAHLLLAELLYKNDYAQTNRTELRQAVAYFDSLLVMTDETDTRGVSLQPRRRRDARRATAQNMAFLAARAHYINGVGYYERDSVVEACKEYLKALEVMEEHFEEKELVGKNAKFMALAYTHLTRLLSDQFLLEQAIYFGKFSLRYYYNHDAPNWHVAWMLVETGSLYDMMEQLDSAAFYYSHALQVLTDTLSLTYRDIAAHQAFLKYKMDKQREPALSKLRYLLTMAESTKEISSRNLTIAEIYYHEEGYDSATVYYNRVLDETENAHSKILSAQRLHEIHGISSDTINSNRYALYLSQFANAGDEHGKLHSQLTALCKEHEHKRQENLHRQSLGKFHLATVSVVLGLLAITAIITLLYFVNKKHRKRLQSEKALAEELLKTESHSHKTQQAALASRLKKSNESLRDVSQQLESIKASMNVETDRLETQLDFSAFMDSPVCKLIMERVNKGNFKSKIDYAYYKDYALDKEDLTALHTAVDRHFGRFTTRLKKAYPSLTKTDLDYCCLYLLGLTDADVAALMQRAYNTVNERNSKLRRIFGSENPISATLRAIANEFTID